MRENIKIRQTVWPVYKYIHIKMASEEHRKANDHDNLTVFLNSSGNKQLKEFWS